MRTDKAVKLARDYGLDLVEIAPKASPPVCRIIDFGKFRYDLSKQEKERKHVSGKLKEIKFRVNIDEHDYITKLRHAESFLDKGNKLKILLQFRGRENAHKELGVEVMKRVRDDLQTMSQVDMQPRLAGRAVTMTLSPLPVGKRKRKFLRENEEPHLEETEGDKENSPSED